MGKKLITIKQAMAHFNVTESLILDLIKNGTLHAYKKGNTIKIDENEMHEWISSLSDADMIRLTKNKNKTRATNKTSNKTPAQEHSQTTVPPNNNIPVFKVQFLSLSANKKLSGAKYKSIPNINAYKYKGMYRYTSGETQNFDEAVRLQAKVRKAGFKDAFIVAFYQGERIDIKKAKEMLKN